MKLEGKHIVITGASGGIGEQIAYEAARQKAVPILLARNVEKLQAIAQQIERTYRVPCHYFRLDVSDIAAVEDVFQQLFDQLGAVDVLVNNAGFGVFRYVEDIDVEEMKAMFAVNVFGLIACTKAVYSHMKARRSGHIINIASQAGKLATPKSSVYAATKHAVLGFTDSLRMEAERYGIFVTAVNPGPIRTNFFQIADQSGEYVKNVERWMLAPEKVAKRVVSVMMTPTREVNMPRWMNAGSQLHRLFPSLFEKVAKRAFFKK
ncbi:SDR family NAD(P)-dependent oxidoreductase [Saccharococcus caldoxylosilyticus]|uniref:SDR family NAD(P)-dependent oxidoreductase n=1 Tax=Saccharococcus caldoxylosilyticus TaxID=81408 RepID=UPI001FCBE607|nr:SDR family oxidoreductase [Parageobacillus caldoxylosilyticus]BDG44224.1 oxidoreductase [Parageobacillus caldoxylosilyticus]